MLKSQGIEIPKDASIRIPTLQWDGGWQLYAHTTNGLSQVSKLYSLPVPERNTGVIILQAGNG